MELIERSGFLTSLQNLFEKVVKGEGHSVLISGEAGIGKTSLVKAFYNDKKNNCKIFLGTCDALFTPRPLAPLYDIMFQMQHEIGASNENPDDRVRLFTKFLHELELQKRTTLIIIEDIHWADEATLDFISFFARRITQFQCLFILTYRDNEIHSKHPLRNVLGQLPPDSFTRMQLTPLSRQAVEKMAEEKGYKGEDVYNISGGIPFYVNEILAVYSIGIPDNIKDAVLSSYNRVDEKTRTVWQILSVLPTGFEIKYLEKMEPAYATAIQNCLDLKILIPKEGLIFFKHELFRRTIETSLSPILRIELNKKILDMFMESFEKNKEIERIIHHAKNANEYELVVEYAPLAAKQAGKLGAHIEAARLYLTAIEYYQGKDKDILTGFYESYAFECYLTNQINEAIIYTTKALDLFNDTNSNEQKSNCLRFLSRLWWFSGNGEKAEAYANKAIGLLTDQPASRIKAMVFSNMSQLKMLSDHRDECIRWGEQAITMAKELGDEETLAHALNNVGTVQLRVYATRQKGTELVKQSLDIALQNDFEEHAIRAYINLGSNAVVMKDYEFAKIILDQGIEYCEARDLDLGTPYLLSFKARQHLEAGEWDEAERITSNLIKNEDQPGVVKIGALIVLASIKMRRGDIDTLPLLLEAREKTLKTMEPQRIMPLMSALMEYEWITGKSLVEDSLLNEVMKICDTRGNMNESSAFAFWLLKTRKQKLAMKDIYEGYKPIDARDVLKASDFWKKLGCPYEQSLILFEGEDDNKREAIEIVHALGADAIYEKMKFEMRASGIKNIPRGIRKTTRANTAHLTERELDVLQLLKEGLQNKEIAGKLFISPKTVDHHISSIFFKLDVKSRSKAVQEAIQLDIIK